ncbi:type I pullulanase [Clostridium sp. LIBA-8841]|uniref:type I pullulanase n=1 Tax=Clostridium sp. LIBA-8841 TaxID=2987530 RepID=UPI002AC6518A|nr:type I pullulanase [Clostridium sp. LIBA-8841]MDZ5252464.1 type I pullulanase [Clostridium sp. LIBA-8841]
MRKNFNSEEFNNKFYYSGELGATYSKDKTIFRVWSPEAKSLELLLYRDGNTDSLIEKDSLNKKENGVWEIIKEGDLNGVYYKYHIVGENFEHDFVDPYCRALGVNGYRGMVIDLEETNPIGWKADYRPELKEVIDSILYEMHIRDFSIDESSGVTIENRGKFLGVVEEKTTIPGTRVKTTLDHLKELGITHVHLLPAFDFGSVDEERLNEPQYNWGYDPVNYNVPEGSYSKNPYKGEARIKEFKEMVLKLHRAGIRVVMDVVYNHTYSGENSNLNLSYPGYYHRQDKNGEFSNGSGCGNELASERLMVRKYMIDSLKYWAKEYHIDGFRFDLMALHDIETLKEIRKEMDKIDTSILIYGEGWNGGESPLPKEEACFKCNVGKFRDLQIAAFSDDMRDGIKGHVSKLKEGGFVNGGNDFEESIKFGIVAATYHKEIDYKKVNYSDESWANEPYQTINYSSAHDNNTLHDKLRIVCENASEEKIIDMNKLSAAIVLTSQGIPFIHAGEELLRSKVNEKGEFIENSYNSNDFVNKIDWTRKIEYKSLFEYYRGLINLRKEYELFRLNNSKEIREKLSFIEKELGIKEKGVVAYRLKDENDEFIVIFNGSDNEFNLTLPKGEWGIMVNKEVASREIINKVCGNYTIKDKAAYVLKKV